MGTKLKGAELKLRRKCRGRKKLSGTAERPRLSLFRSAKHVYAQVIDDTKGQTLASASSMNSGDGKRAGIEACRAIGVILAERCKEKSIDKVCFDKNGNMYHGRVKAFAEGAREAGLNF